MDLLVSGKIYKMRTFLIYLLFKILQSGVVNVLWGSAWRQRQKNNYEVYCTRLSRYRHYRTKQFRIVVASPENVCVCFFFFFCFNWNQLSVKKCAQLEWFQIFVIQSRRMYYIVIAGQCIVNKRRLYATYQMIHSSLSYGRVL